MTVKECPFCDKEELNFRTLLTSKLFLAIVPQKPLNLAHTLIITKRHRENLLELSTDESKALVGFTKKVCKLLQAQHQNSGFNIFTNVGEKSGQSVPHFHLHILPRFQHEKVSPLSKIKKS